MNLTEALDRNATVKLLEHLSNTTTKYLEHISLHCIELPMYAAQPEKHLQNSTMLSL